MQVTEERGESGAFLRTEAKKMQLPLQCTGQGRFPDTHRAAAERLTLYQETFS